MMPIRISFKQLVDHSVSCYALIVEQELLEQGIKKYFNNDHVQLIRAVAQERKFIGTSGQILTVPCMDNNNALFTVLLIGIGKKEKRSSIPLERYRRALGTIVRIAEDHKYTSVAIQLPSAILFDTTEENLAQQTATIVEMAGYHFDEFITAPERKITTPQEVILVSDAKDQKLVRKAVDTGKVIAQSVNKARYWIDLPPTNLSPIELTGYAQKIAQETGMECTVFTEPEIIQMGMGGLAGVSKGSALDCHLVILKYTTKKKGAPTIGFVGKGITFDSGGLSIKPAAYMETMKEDMSGAAAVISAMQAIAILKPEINVVGITPLAENLPSGSAIKPGDILRFYNGKTAEVKNTDAEGRLILADALSYAVKHCALDAIIDIATLTGACAYALGPFFSGLMSQHEDLISRIHDASEQSGDRVWELPLHDDYKTAIKSQVADICNIGSKAYNAGAITAAFFLQQFVGDVPWAHLDIAGTAFNVPDIPYYRPEGATGAGVRLFIELALNWKK